ncbi:MAG: hypothetical protein FWG94_02750 [Oscillospiraceae bacterium]|nr:hypothetical protein [Oscillospiraceae bacterium]
MQMKSTRRRYAAPIGGLFITLAVIGIITVISIAVRLTILAIDNTSEKEMFGDIIMPVVMFNPPPFERPTDIEMPGLLLYSMWSALLDSERNYQFSDESGELLVPASDIDVAAARLFGPEVALQHQSFGEFENTYYFDESTSMYIVPVNVQYNVYTPSVEEITKKGELYELRVGYIPSGITWQIDLSGGMGQAAPDKYMNYIMQKSGGGGYYIVKLQDVESSYVLFQPEDYENGNNNENDGENEDAEEPVE